MADKVSQILFLSALLSKPVRGASGEVIGALKDMVVRMTETELFPPVTGLVTAVASRRGHRFFIHATDIAEVTAAGVRLTTDKVNLAPFARRDHEVLLNKDVLDKQLVDVNGRRVIRVNDVTLSYDPVYAVYRLAAVDISAASLADRLGIKPLARRLTREVIPWDSVQFFASEAPVVKLKLSYDKLARLHPADLADIINELGYQQGGEVIAALADSEGDEFAADTVEELDPELQAAVIGSLDVEDAADIIEEMDTDEAADLLADLPPEQAEDILEAMEAEEAAEVRELLQYEEDTAGGIMSTDYLPLPQEMTVGEALARLRGEEAPEFIYYIYVVDAGETLLGIVSLRSLLMGRDDQTLSEIMAPTEDVVVTQVTESARQAAQDMLHYNLMAMPVLDEGKLVGIIMQHDAVEQLVPEESGRSFFGGRR